MNSTDLDLILTVLRKHSVASAEVPLATGPLRLVFAPDVMPPGDPVTPGGWKSMPRLDNPEQFSEVP